MTSAGGAERWRYRAANSAGVISRGEVAASSAEEAREAICGMRLMPIEILVAPQGLSRKTAMDAQQMALGLRILADLIDSGLPLTRVLTTFESLAPRVWKMAIPSLLAAVREGRSLAHALAESPILIPPIVTGILAAGEAGSGLGQATRTAADLMEATAATQAAVRAALAYPAILAVAGFASISLLIGMVLPRFAEILAGIGQELPPATRILIQTSLAARALFLPVILAVVAVVAAWYLWVQGNSGRRAWHRFLLSLPFVAQVRLSYASARAATTLSALLSNGVALPRALAHAARATGDAEVAFRITSATDLITRGHTLEHALKEARAVTPTTIRLVGAGEQTSKLAAMLQHAARIEQDFSDRTVRRWVKLLEPSLVMVFALVVGMVAAALLQAVYSVKPNV